MRNFLRDIKVGTKIFVLIGLTVLLMSSIIGLGLRQITMIGGEVKAIAEEDVILLEALNKIVFHNSEQAFHFERAIRFGKRMAQDEAAKGEFETERKNYLKYGQMIAQEIKENRAFVERMYEKYKTTHRREKRVLQVDYELRNIDKEHADYQFLAERVFNLLFQGKLKEAELTIQKITREGKEEHLGGMNKPVESLVLAIEGFVEDSIVRAEESKRTAVIGMSLISVCVLLFSLSLGIFVSRSISKPLRIAVNAARQISAGVRDIKIEAIAKDETGQLLQAMKTMSFAVGEAEEKLIQQTSKLEQSNTALKKEITERKQAEEALEITNRDLTLMTGKLEESNRELKDFVYIASHDLREPLRKISSFGELLKDSFEGKLNRDEKENLEFMVDGANRMTEMIEGLLTYSRVNTKGISFQAVNLNEVAEQLEQLELAVLLEETGGTIEVPQPLPVVEADPIQMRQLLQNLIANGIRYRRDEVRPRIVIRAKHTDGDKVRIEVQDNGIGIRQEHYEDIFTMFRRLHPRQRYGGTGIGLALCRKIIDRHGGRIGVESKYGEGTTLWFTLSAVSEAVAVS